MCKDIVSSQRLIVQKLNHTTNKSPNHYFARMWWSIYIIIIIKIITITTTFRHAIAAINKQHNKVDTSRLQLLCSCAKTWASGLGYKAQQHKLFQQGCTVLHFTYRCAMSNLNLPFSMYAYSLLSPYAPCKFALL